ncbi:leucine-rich repeat domain-containing protein [Trichothermofontia sp.]
MWGKITRHCILHRLGGGLTVSQSCKIGSHKSGQAIFNLRSIKFSLLGGQFIDGDDRDIAGRGLSNWLSFVKFAKSCHHKVNSYDDESLAGLQLSSFITLNLVSPGTSDLAPLANIKNLQFLLLHENQITDLSPLKNLTNLRVLYLGSNRIRDLGPVASLVYAQPRMTHSSWGCRGVPQARQ